MTRYLYTKENEEGNTFNIDFNLNEIDTHIQIDLNIISHSKGVEEIVEALTEALDPYKKYSIPVNEWFEILEQNGFERQKL